MMCSSQMNLLKYMTILLIPVVQPFRISAPQIQRHFMTPKGTSSFLSMQETPPVSKVGVLLLNLGGPDTLDDVEPFLFNLFNDPMILTLPKPLQPFRSILARFISKTRAPIASEGYASIGGGSPLKRITMEQGKALEERLANQGVDAKAYIAMRYSHPFTSDAVKEMVADGVKECVVLPLYPQFSTCTTGSSLIELEKQLAAIPAKNSIANVVVKEWYTDDGYVESLTDSIEENLKTAPTGAHIVFSAHGVPVKYVELGDPYIQQMESCVELVVQRLRARGFSNEYSLAYQSKVGPVEWAKPSTTDKLTELGNADSEGVVMVPISFVSEHIETLEEMDVEYRELAEKMGVQSWSRVPALGTRPSFINSLANMVLDALPQVHFPKDNNNYKELTNLNVYSADNNKVRARGNDSRTGKIVKKITVSIKETLGKPRSLLGR